VDALVLVCNVEDTAFTGDGYSLDAREFADELCLDRAGVGVLREGAAEVGGYGLRSVPDRQESRDLVRVQVEIHLKKPVFIGHTPPPRPGNAHILRARHPKVPSRLVSQYTTGS
jgi:hypothetical protein